MTWILEEPVYILILGAVAFLFIGFAFMQTGYRFLLHALLAVVALSAGLLILERSVQTNREMIEDALDKIAGDVETNDLERILANVYSGAPEIYRRAENEFPRYTFQNVKIKSNVEATFDNDEQPREAVVTFNVVVDVEFQGVRHPRVPSFVKIKLILEDGRWKVADYSHTETGIYRQ